MFHSEWELDFAIIAREGEPELGVQARSLSVSGQSSGEIRPLCSADMPHVLCLLLFVLSCTNSVTCSLIFATTGKDVTLRCQCSKNPNCHEEVIRWVRMDSNESLQIIDNKCEQSHCRFASKTLNGTHVVLLTIAQVEPGDSGRYYCVEHYKRDIQFNDNGTLLMVGDVWTDSSEVDLLNEWTGEGGSPELDWSEAQTPNSSQEFIFEWRNETNASDFLDEWHTELRCVVTRLSAPWVNIYWRSTRESWNKTGQTWSLTDTERAYRVESQLRIGLKVKSDWEDEYEDEYEYEHEYGYLDKMVEMDEELWCEVQVGVNVSVQSPKFSFRQQGHTDSEWCNGLLYGEIALCVLCVCLLILLICHCLRHQHKGSEPSATEVSPTQNSCRDVSSDTTYERRHRQKSRQKNSQEERLVYSEVRYKCEERVLHG
ncbi:uncharacterized protein LOC118220725 isoform X2 [Anguilla anguilla]|uniref:uncharacterized protein LOC118220725 isoform X2 n=1 Tax=Anguilla anguilla TaxID=7936 RepID=UPI0015A9A937|nr:uncharacterized protein LOC118220725 isoform X2 [Anguilla anguilla]